MLLSMAQKGKSVTVSGITGKTKIRKHLADLGLRVGASVYIVSSFSGNVIVGIGNSQVALSEDLARHIYAL